MLRRFLVTLCKRAFILVMLICLGCSAQLAPSELSQRIEHQLRASYNVPATVKVDLSPLRASDFPNYDAGSEGPKAADELIARKGHRWRSISEGTGSCDEVLSHSARL